MCELRRLLEAFGEHFSRVFQDSCKSNPKSQLATWEGRLDSGTGDCAPAEKPLQVLLSSVCSSVEWERRREDNEALCPLW